MPKERKEGGSPVKNLGKVLLETFENYGPCWHDETQMKNQIAEQKSDGVQLEHSAITGSTRSSSHQRKINDWRKALLEFY